MYQFVFASKSSNFLLCPIWESVSMDFLFLIWVLKTYIFYNISVWLTNGSTILWILYLNKSLLKQLLIEMSFARFDNNTELNWLHKSEALWTNFVKDFMVVTSSFSEEVEGKKTRTLSSHALTHFSCSHLLPTEQHSRGFQFLCKAFARHEMELIKTKEYYVIHII